MTTPRSARPDRFPCELQEEVELSGQGRLRGRREGELIVYRGVRYAQAPFGENRFGPPKRVTPWVGTRAACEFAPASPQAPRVQDSQVYGGIDCLALNIWTPVSRSGRLPVLVWIPGGAYMRGDACDPIYDGAVFARQGIVFVSLNYRVGIDGLMLLPDAPANRGLLDQIAGTSSGFSVTSNRSAATRASDGGGRSAGAGAITCLLGMSRANALFSRAILQSPSVATQTTAEATSSADAICGLLSVARTAKSMATVPTADCVSAVSRLANDPALARSLGMTSKNVFPLRAVVDGEVLAEAPLPALHRHWMRRSTDISILVGSNRDEMRLYAVPDGGIDRVTNDDVRRFVTDTGLPTGAEDSYRLALSIEGHSSPSPGEVLCAMQSDYFYRIPARRIAEHAAATGVDVYLYEFEWESSRFERRLRAAHGVEIPFVFQKLMTEPGQEITGPGAPADLATEMNEAWVSFVKSGDSGWPRFEKANRWIRRFGGASAVDHDVTGPEARVWESVI